ncbi:MAG: hypothetical protein U9R05_03915, partial [Chloroflexota bacterium]|nr:hypothetical protein [Chloroflexota bacterium]
MTVAVAALVALGTNIVTEKRNVGETLCGSPKREGEKARERESEKAKRREGEKAKKREGENTHHAPRTTHHVSRLLLLDTAPNTVSFLAALAIWGGLLLLGGLWTSRLAFDQIEPFVTRVFWSLAQAPSAFPDARAFYSYEFPWIQ